MAILTSGGDAPGMNAAVRAVARTAFSMGWQVMKVGSGYKGLLEGDISPVDRRRLGGIIGRGGTVLGTERAKEFQTPDGQKAAVRRFEEAGVEGLVVIGGEGSLTRAMKLSELGIEIVGIPATIDNDVWGTEIAIGVDTAFNTALETIDRIKDTASSRHRAHVIEVMGRNCPSEPLYAPSLDKVVTLPIPNAGWHHAGIKGPIQETVAYLSGLLFSGLPRVAPYCVRGGIRVVSDVSGSHITDSSTLGP